MNLLELSPRLQPILNRIKKRKFHWWHNQNGHPSLSFSEPPPYDTFNQTCQIECHTQRTRNSTDFSQSRPKLKENKKFNKLNQSITRMPGRRSKPVYGMKKSGDKSSLKTNPPYQVKNNNKESSLAIRPSKLASSEQFQQPCNLNITWLLHD